MTAIESSCSISAFKIFEKKKKNNEEIHFCSNVLFETFKF